MNSMKFDRWQTGHSALDRVKLEEYFDSERNKAVTPMTLTAYEEKQIAEIANWKALRPSVLESTLGRLTGAVYDKIGSIVPHTHVGDLLVKAFELAERIDTKTEIKNLAHVNAIEDLKYRTLEDCDKLTDQIERKAEAVGLTEAVLSEAGGIATELANMPFQAREVITFLKRFAHCYGYTLEGKSADAYLKGLIILAHETKVEKRQELLHRLRSLEFTELTKAELQAENEEIEKEIGAGFAEGSIMEFVPYMGVLVSVYNDFEYFHHLSITAKHVFQERHLRDQGKVLEIPPAAVSQRESTLANAYGFVKEIFYISGYGVGYGASFIGFGTGTLVKRFLPPVAGGAIDGGGKASADAGAAADRVTEALKRPLGLAAPTQPTA